MNGQELFRLYVEAALCTGEYRWEYLTNEQRRRWNEMAQRMITLPLTSAREIAGMLEEAAKVISSLPEDVAAKHDIRHFLPDELSGGAGIVNDAIEKAGK